MSQNSLLATAQITGDLKDGVLVLDATADKACHGKMLDVNACEEGFQSAIDNCELLLAGSKYSILKEQD